jgi:hypothetical protein
MKKKIVKNNLKKKKKLKPRCSNCGERGWHHGNCPKNYNGDEYSSSAGYGGWGWDE